MQPASIHFFAIITAAVINMALGALWYSPLLFAKPWLRSIDLQGGEPLDKDLAKQGYLASSVASFVSAFLPRHSCSNASRHRGFKHLVPRPHGGLGFVRDFEPAPLSFRGQKPELLFDQHGLHGHFADTDVDCHWTLALKRQVGPLALTGFARFSIVNSYENWNYDRWRTLRV